MADFKGFPGKWIRTSVVYQIFGNFTKGSAFLAKVYDDPATPLLRFFDGFFHTKDKIRTASADVRAKHVTTITFVMYTQCKTDIRV